ncbi:MAG: sigma-54-dependent Fis family transcriptional regulator [Burkholderiaceae bacterium]|jgi:transcriptional regulator of acetoin/glycerol metabolism
MDASLVKHVDFVNSAVRNAMQGAAEPGEDRILRSWVRCVRDYRLDPARDYEVVVVDNSELRSLQTSMSELLDTARVEMSNLHQQLAGSGFAILLTDPNGIVLHCVGDPEFMRSGSKTGVLPGADWSEQARGTNGMGTCLFEKRPLVVHREQHLLTCNVDLTCSAAPIFDPHGNLLGALDASANAHLAQQHTLVLVNMSVQTIENRLFLHQYRNAYIIRFHSRAEFVCTLGEGEIAVSEAGIIRAANRSALFQLDFPSHAAIEGKDIAEVFNLTPGDLIDHGARSWSNPIPLYEATRGNRYFAIIQQPDHVGRALAELSRPKPVRGATHDHDRVQLRDLGLGDPVMEKNIERAVRIVDSDIPVLISGETGTGKELFARAIHNSGRKPRPFVAINCASLPESLIESELFGYASGAFTGARREGRRGKILQANGGTLFLDEIGDMPIALQARLLRVLEDRELTPLGTETAVKVEFRLISATHRDLPELIERGEFREDLYYRLQGVEICLPPLRERADRRALIESLLVDNLSNGRLFRLDEQALALLESHSWPGNVRQLRNALRAAIALCTDGRISVDELPEELRRRCPPQSVRPPEPVPEEENHLNRLESAERAALLEGLARHRWKVTSLARELRVSRNTLYRKMKRCNIGDRRD